MLLPRKPKAPRPGSAPYLQQFGSGTGLYTPPKLPGSTPPKENVTRIGGQYGGYNVDPWMESMMAVDPLGTPQQEIDRFSGPGPVYEGYAPTPAGGGGVPAPGLPQDARAPIGIWQKPDYSGILGKYTQDWQARLNAGLASMEAQRLSRARAGINRLGIRDPAAALAKLGKFGITAEDLRLAAENPWSEIKGIQKQAERARGQSQAEFAARGGFRSGGTAQSMEDIEDARARTEAMATQEMESGLSGDVFQQAEWERQQRDELDQRSADLETQLAQAYQPYQQTANWDANLGGYRLGNTVYDQYGTVIRTL